MNIRELVRHMQATPSDRALQRATGLNRRTIHRYRTWAQAQGLLTGPLAAHRGIPAAAHGNPRATPTSKGFTRPSEVSRTPSFAMIRRARN
jgi:hypothetical protein